MKFDTDVHEHIQSIGNNQAPAWPFGSILHLYAIGFILKKIMLNSS